MRSDVRALLKLLGASVLLAVVAMGIIAAAAFGILPRQAAVYTAAAVFVVGVAAVARQFTRALVPPARGRDTPAGPDSPPDGPGD
jgi:hypothetical protein